MEAEDTDFFDLACAIITQMMHWEVQVLNILNLRNSETLRLICTLVRAGFVSRVDI